MNRSNLTLMLVAGVMLAAMSTAQGAEPVARTMMPAKELRGILPPLTGIALRGRPNQ